MRFLIEWEWSELRSGEEQQNVLALFAAWKPPIELSDWSGFADGSGGCLIAETNDPNELAKVTAPWAPWFRFKVRAILPIEQTAATMQEAINFRQSVG